MAFIHQYRFAAAETVEKDKAPKAVSMLLLAGIVSAFIGITLANKTKDLISDHVYVGSYIALACLTIMPAIFLSFYKNSKITNKNNSTYSNVRTYKEFVSDPKYLQAMVAATFGYVVMAFLMTATPLYISGTSLLVTTYNEQEKFKAQGFNDLIVFSATAIGSLSAGILISLLSWKIVNFMCIPFLIIILFVILRADIKKAPAN